MFGSIRSKTILLLLLFSLVPLAASRAIFYPKIRKAFQEAKISDLENAGYKQTNLITAWMNERKYDARAFANEYLVSSFTEFSSGDQQFARLTSHLCFLRDTYGYKEISIIDNSGVIRVSTTGNLVGVNVSGFDYFQEAKKGKAFVSSIRPSTFPILNEDVKMETGVPTLFVLSPIRNRADQTVGLISLRVDVIALSREMRLVKMGESGETYLVDKNGFMISESRFVPTIRKMGLVKKRTALELKLIDPETGQLTKGVQAALKGEDGYDAGGYRDYRGVLVLGFWHWLPEYQWALMSEIDVEEAYKALHDLDGMILFVTVIITLAVIVSAIFLGRKFTAPILHFTEVTKKMAGGNLSQRAIVYSSDEIGQLAESFNSMTQTIEIRNEQLESVSQYLESIFDAIKDVIAVVDKEGTILRVNQAAIDEYGEDVIGRNCIEVFMGKGQTCEGCRNLDVIENLRPSKHEHVAPAKNKVFFTQSYPLLDSKGGLEAIIMVSRDITRQKGAEQGPQGQALNPEDKKYRNRTDTTPPA
ncbi:MAG: cache domain-containing protein [Candidatus Brocadiales bacterium]